MLTVAMALAISISISISVSVSSFVPIVMTVSLVILIATIAVPALAPLPAIIAWHFNEINGPGTCVVSGAVFRPIFGMPGRHMQIKRLLLHKHRRALNDERLHVDQRRRRRIADFDATIHARRQGALHRCSRVGSNSVSGTAQQGRQSDKSGHQQWFRIFIHGFFLLDSRQN
ncbi:MAG: hypothetical protein WAW69_07390 [Polaromonas sp.]